jgi:hypothetical protein
MSKPQKKDAAALLSEIMNAAIKKANEMDVDEEPLSSWPPEPDSRPELSTIETAIAVALAAHRGQKDKAGAPYILHPLRLMLQMETEQEMIAAVLHDVIEDAALSIEYLTNRGFERMVLEGVQSVTRREGESYDDFIVRAGLHPLGSKIKVADILDNMNLNRIASLTEDDLKRVIKYHRALKLLKDLQGIRRKPVEVDYFRAGGNIHVAKVALVPRGLPYPNALNAYGSAGTIIIHFDGVASEAVMPEHYLTLGKILQTRDPEMLYTFNPYWAPFFCPECREAYPYDEWDISDDGYGSCPKGHRRKLEDR